MASVGAIVPTYNRAGLVGECVGSLLAQSLPLAQILVVDDGSTDDTRAALACFGDRIEVVAKANGGKSSALNLALPRMRTDLVWICDDDDVAAPDGARLLHDALVAAPHAPFAYGHYRPFEDIGAERRVGDPSGLGRAGAASFLVGILEEMYVFQFATLARRESYARTGPFREDLVRSQDFDMLVRLARLGEPAYVPETIFLQRRHGGQRGSATVSFGEAEAYANAIRFSGRIMRDLRGDLPVAAYTPAFAQGRPEAERAALLGRGLVYAQRSLWPEAADDLAAAAALAGGASASAEEQALAKSVVRDLKPWPILAGDPASLRALIAIRRSGAWGQAIVAALVGPLGWLARGHLQRGRVAEFAALAGLLVRVAGARSALGRVGRLRKASAGFAAVD